MFPKDDRRKQADKYLEDVKVGSRIGALPDIDVKHIAPLYSKKKRHLLAGAVRLYVGTPAEYFTFITPEC